jgi:1-acyl-sn-glycerol-3-phosphate acyltransferase
MRAFALAVAVFVALALVAASAGAQTPPTRIRGTVERVDGQTVLVKSRDGAEVAVALPKDGKVGTLQRASLADIKAGDFIGSAAMPGADGRLHAQEVVIFPEAMRGTGEGHYAWDLKAGSTMTNAAVVGIAAAPDGSTLTLKHKDGQTEIDVPQDVPIVRIGPPGDAGLLVPGAAVFIVASQGGDGTWTALRMIVEKDGVKPPM